MEQYRQEYDDTTNTDTLRSRIRFVQNRVNQWRSKIRDRRLMKK